MHSCCSWHFNFPRYVTLWHEDIHCSPQTFSDRRSVTLRHKVERHAPRKVIWHDVLRNNYKYRCRNNFRNHSSLCFFQWGSTLCSRHCFYHPVKPFQRILQCRNSSLSSPFSSSKSSILCILYEWDYLNFSSSPSIGVRNAKNKTLWY